MQGDSRAIRGPSREWCTRCQGSFCFSSPPQPRSLALSRRLSATAASARRHKMIGAYCPAEPPAYAGVTGWRGRGRQAVGCKFGPLLCQRSRRAGMMTRKRKWRIKRYLREGPPRGSCRSTRGLPSLSQWSALPLPLLYLHRSLPLLLIHGLVLHTACLPFSSRVPSEGQAQLRTYQAALSSTMQDMQPANEWLNLKEEFLFDWPLLTEQVRSQHHSPPLSSTFPGATRSCVVSLCPQHPPLAVQGFATRLAGIFAFFAIIISYPIASDTYGAPDEATLRLLASSIGGLAVVNPHTLPCPHTN